MWMKFFSDLFSIWRSNKNVLSQSQLCLTNSFCGQRKRLPWYCSTYFIQHYISSCVLYHNFWHVMQATKKKVIFFIHKVNSRILWLCIRIKYFFLTQLCVIFSVISIFTFFFALTNSQLRRQFGDENRLLKSFQALACEFPLIFYDKSCFFSLRV